MRVAASLLLLCAGCALGPAAPSATDEPVGRSPEGDQVTPVNQRLTPYGVFVDLPGLRPQAIAPSRDGRHVYVSGKTSELLVVDVATGAIAQRVALPGASRRGQLSYTGLLVSADGGRIYLSDVGGAVVEFAVDRDGGVTATRRLPLPPANAPRRTAEIPAGLALSADGERLYVCGNLSNTLLELDLATGAVLRRLPVGVAPFDVVLAHGRAFVSNLGGRRPEPGDRVGPAGRGTTVRVDARDIASEGSVTVLDLASGERLAETVTGLHASDLALAPDGLIACANAGSDTVSLLDRDGAVVDTVWARVRPNDLLQASPNALCFTADGDRLLVANGTMNAIAVFDYDDRELLGFVPVGWYPSALCAIGRRVCATNVKGLGFGRPRGGDGAAEFNTHQYHGSLSLFDLPGEAELPALTTAVERNLRRAAIEYALLPPRPDQPARAIPERIGEPSRIEHVVYVIKENRTYDQVLGDLDIGNGDPELCVFGERVTPNQHALARQFVLLDNTYCAGILSADGHNWTMAAFGSDYLEKSFAGWPRSYPDGMGEDDADALAWSPAGFLWDRAIEHGITLRNYGEFCGPKVRWRDPERPGSPGWTDCWRATRGETDDVIFACEPMVRSLAPYTPTGYVGWNMSVPDQFRADFVLRELAEFEAKGEFPQLVLICLPNDHTSGTSKDCPTPAACVADGDLAFGRIVEALSHSRFWPKMAIFGIEDDPQAGWDHVSGYRTTCFVASPFARRGVTVSTQYNTTSVLRTIEQILGLLPMNCFDASAQPMFDCFTDEPDLTPFTALPNQVPLDQMNPGSAAIADPILRRDAELSATFDFSQVDRAPEDALNRILWRAMKGSGVPYPQWAVSADLEDDDDER